MYSFSNLLSFGFGYETYIAKTDVPQNVHIVDILPLKIKIKLTFLIAKHIFNSEALADYNLLSCKYLRDARIHSKHITRRSSET
jgi:hypothetical protein